MGIKKDWSTFSDLASREMAQALVLPGAWNSIEPRGLAQASSQPQQQVVPGTGTLLHPLPAPLGARADPRLLCP